MDAAANKRYVKLGLIGHPVSHSISPSLHGAALSYAGLEGEYNLIDVPNEEQLGPRVRALVSEGYTGWNVTVPHKQAMYRLVDELTEPAAKAGAVNTVKVSSTAGGAKLVGHNTDLGGFKSDLQSFVPELRDRVTLILGAGGAARAAVWALLESDVRHVWIAARSIEQSQALSSVSSKCQAVTVDVAHLIDVIGPTIVINCTPIGLKVKNSPGWVTKLLERPFPAPASDRYFYDMVYSSTAGDTTLLVSEAQKLGWVCRDGRGMLLNQAALAFEFWTGVQIPPEKMLHRT